MKHILKPSKRDTNSFDWNLIIQNIPTEKQYLFNDFIKNGVNYVTEENCSALMYYLESACPPKVESDKFTLVFWK